MKASLQYRDENIPNGSPRDLDEAEFSSIVAAGGGRYVGVWKQVPGKMEPVVLFSSPRTRTTLSLPVSRLTAQSVREHLAESDAAFAGADRKNDKA
jgi:hypothetical protein